MFPVMSAFDTSGPRPLVCEIIFSWVIFHNLVIVGNFGHIWDNLGNYWGNLGHFWNTLWHFCIYRLKCFCIKCLCIDNTGLNAFVFTVLNDFVYTGLNAFVYNGLNAFICIYRPKCFCIFFNFGHFLISDRGLGLGQY